MAKKKRTIKKPAKDSKRRAEIKSALKKAKRPAARTGYDPLPSRRRPRHRLLAKIALIRDEIPDIEPTGHEVDEDTQEIIFYYTEAQQVFTRYVEVLKRHNMLVRPYAEPGMMPQVSIEGRLVVVAMCFEITDLDTGESVIGPGVGAGINWDWAANTAQTRALKQFFLTSFGATWKDPEVIRHEYAEKMLRQARNASGSAMTPSETAEAMKAYFGGEQVDKEPAKKGGKKPHKK